MRHVHANPAKSGLVDRAEDYPFGSLVTIHSQGRLESLPHKSSSGSTSCLNSV